MRHPATAMNSPDSASTTGRVPAGGSSLGSADRRPTPPPPALPSPAVRTPTTAVLLRPGSTAPAGIRAPASAIAAGSPGPTTLTGRSRCPASPPSDAAPAGSRALPGPPAPRRRLRPRNRNLRRTTRSSAHSPRPRSSAGARVSRRRAPQRVTGPVTRSTSACRGRTPGRAGQGTRASVRAPRVP